MSNLTKARALVQYIAENGDAGGHEAIRLSSIIFSGAPIEIILPMLRSHLQDAHAAASYILAENGNHRQRGLMPHIGEIARHPDFRVRACLCDYILLAFDGPNIDTCATTLRLLSDVDQRVRGFACRAFSKLPLNFYDEFVPAPDLLSQFRFLRITDQDRLIKAIHDEPAPFGSIAACALLRRGHRLSDELASTACDPAVLVAFRLNGG